MQTEQNINENINIRIAILSDLHQEFGAFTPQKMDADVIILNGDNATTPEYLRRTAIAMKKINPKAVILLTLGNHEAHDKIFQSYRDLYAKALSDLPDTFLLDDSHIEIEGFTFVGGTLWTDLNPIAAIAIQQTLEDYRPTGIRSNDDTVKGRAVTPSEIGEAHRKTLRYIENILRSCEDPSHVVVITHHSPSQKSWEHRDGPLSDRLIDAYCNNLDDFIEAYSPAVWYHGHLHNTNNYMIGNTIIRSNPRGYQRMENGIAVFENSRFDPTGNILTLTRKRQNLTKISDLINNGNKINELKNLERVKKTSYSR